MQPAELPAGHDLHFSEATWAEWKEAFGNLSDAERERYHARAELSKVEAKTNRSRVAIDAVSKGLPSKSTTLPAIALGDQVNDVTRQYIETDTLD